MTFRSLSISASKKALFFLFICELCERIHHNFKIEILNLLLWNIITIYSKKKAEKRTKNKQF